MWSQLFRNAPQALAVWVLADARAGTANQALGVAEALALPFAVIPLGSHPLLTRLAGLVPRVSVPLLNTANKVTLYPPWPHIIIAAGRRAAVIARWIRTQAGQTALTVPFLVQIMFPGWQGLADFDLVAIPNHDRLVHAPDNVLHITGAPHRLTPMALTNAADRWRHRFHSFPRPRIVCLVGGASRCCRPLTAEIARSLATRTATLAKISSGSILLTTSRRTDKTATAVLLSELIDSRVPLFTYHWGDIQENPYIGLLALADSVVVTGDSVSMCTEACAQTGPVFIFAPPGWVKGKHARLHAELFALGYARPLPPAEERVFSYWDHPPLNPAGAVAEEIKMRLFNGASKPPCPERDRGMEKQ